MHILQPVPVSTYKPRIYINGFPKSGLHLLDLLISVLVDPSANGRGGAHDLGTFKWHSWTNELINLRSFLWRLSCLERGSYLKGHCGYFQEIEYIMYYANISHIFIYRDLRDVAVSQAYHITSDDCRLAHEHKSFFKMFDNFDEVLKAVITGIGPYPGVVSRWKMYAPWLDVNWVMSLKFEDLKNDLEDCCKAITNYVLYNATHLLEDKIADFTFGEGAQEELIEKMVEQSQKTHLSVTYRKGQSGEWQTHFKQEHIDQWMKNDPDNWIEKLGYSW